ncbi:MAG: two-component sensor histidine kinase [Lachnospiraceae bacterium]|nr:two-component sensor histidine kinase [Lachnospiraceae bacterium]
MYDDEKLDKYAEVLSKDNIRLTIIDKDGKVTFDNEYNVSELNNHKTRAEIADAYKKGEGSSVRRSDTFKITNFYYAVKLEDGSVIRTARETRSIYGIFTHAFPLIFGIVVLLLIVCYIISHFLTKSIVKPIEEMAGKIIENIDNKEGFSTSKRVNTEGPENNVKGGAGVSKKAGRVESNNEVYRELEPVMDHIKLQHDDILKGAALRQEFTANVSHELKTPLTSISGYSELIENGMASEEDTRKFAAEIHRSSDRLLVLINDIIKLSELDSEGNVINFEKVNLYDIVLNCQAMMEPEAEKLEVIIKATGEDTFINANKTMMEELVYNLCDNAVRYNKPGGHVYIEVKDKTLSVRDDGIGVPTKYQERIFERFFRVDKSRSKKTGGTGLGLSIVKHIVELHSAKLKFESEAGKGTRVTVKF